MKSQLTASVVRSIDFLLKSAIKFMRICYLSRKEWGTFTDIFADGPSWLM